MLNRIPMTINGYHKIQDELKHLKTVDRPDVIQAIAESRNQEGDLCENSEYIYARDRQAHIESRIIDLETKLSKAEIIDLSKLSGSNVTFGATVQLEDDHGHIVRYQIVGEDESDIKNGLLSITSPLGRILIGKIRGDVIDLKTPSGSKSYEILNVSF